MTPLFPILGKLKAIFAAMMVMVLVVSQVGMSQAMAAMPDHGHGNDITRSSSMQVPSVSLDKSSDVARDSASGNTVPEHTNPMVGDGHVDFSHDDQGNHCAALCMSGLLPFDLAISAPLATDLKFSRVSTFGLPNAVAGLKRPPRT